MRLRIEIEDDGVLYQINDVVPHFDKSEAPRLLVEYCLGRLSDELIDKVWPE